MEHNKENSVARSIKIEEGRVGCSHNPLSPSFEGNSVAFSREEISNFKGKIVTLTAEELVNYFRTHHPEAFRKFLLLFVPQIINEMKDKKDKGVSET